MQPKALRYRRHSLTLASAIAWAGLAGVAGCSKEHPSDPAAGSPSPVSSPDQPVGYDLRRLRPRNDEPLSEMFERLRTRALAEGKQVAVLFSAGWCEPCQRLELELGNRQPADDIGHVRILEIKEEDWEQVTRMNEVKNLRRRWYPALDSYPVFIVLDEQAAKVEEMKEAITRLTEAGIEPTVAHWFRSLRPDPA